jgi:hypothetical protein
VLQEKEIDAVSCDNTQKEVKEEWGYEEEFLGKGRDRERGSGEWAALGG